MTKEELNKYLNRPLIKKEPVKTIIIYKGISKEKEDFISRRIKNE